MFKRRSPKVYDDDDGRVIANMNLEGMPGYNPDRKERKAAQELDLTREEKRAITGGALKAAFLVVGVIVGAYLLFILFCLFIWLR
ncbi:MAG: hypothetical protein IJB47_05600 [Oscillospiraceae bacterium]|nr:hypothetical protein [Oscillospiraceae bacterium]